MTSDNASGRVRAFQRPRLYPPESFTPIAGGPDPVQVAEAASKLAHLLVERGQQAEGNEIGVVNHLVDLVDDVGMDVIAELWADAPAISLGGALWRLYALQQAVRADGDQWAAWYRAGYDAQVARAIAGAVEPPNAQDLQNLVEQILTGVYSGDFGVALDRAAAYGRVVSLGMAHHADQLETTRPDAADALVQRAHRLLRTAEELDASAASWRAGGLE